MYPPQQSPSLSLPLSKMAAVKSHLDSLPFELKFKLLRALPDISTLSNLVHASPAYHELYVANCEKIFTAVTINGLEGKGIDILKPTPFVLVRILRRTSLRLLEYAVIQ